MSYVIGYGGAAFAVVWYGLWAGFVIGTIGLPYLISFILSMVFT